MAAAEVILDLHFYLEQEALQEQYSQVFNHSW